MNVVALAGGVGGAKLAHGLAHVLAPGNLTVVVNTGDDFEHLGLHISPDLDTVCYTLAGVANRATGWGRARETWNAMRALGELDGPTWFRLGDRDLATHLERTRRLEEGRPLSRIVHEFCSAWNVKQVVLPMTDSPVATMLQTDEGELDFQEYFVHRRCEPRVQGIRFRGAESALPAPGVVQALEAAEVVVICPSNPWVSIAPILAVPGIKELMADRSVAAVSPIIGGRALRGPAAKMFAEMGIQPSALAVAERYLGLAGALVIDGADAPLQESIRNLGLRTLVTKTIMRTLTDRRRLARDVLDFLREDST